MNVIKPAKPPKCRHVWSSDIKFIDPFTRPNWADTAYHWTKRVHETCSKCKLIHERLATGDEILKKSESLFCQVCDRLLTDHDDVLAPLCLEEFAVRLKAFEERLNRLSMEELMTQGNFSIGSKTWSGAAKIIEEAGELSQVIGKLIGTGGNTHYFDGTELEPRLIEELGDLSAAIDFFRIVNFSQEQNELIARRKHEKLQKFFAYHDAHVGGK